MVHHAGLRLFKGEGYASFEWSQLGYPTPEDERVRNAVAALDLLRRERAMVPAAAEFFVYSVEDGGAGTGDAAIWTDETCSAVDIYDWKTSGAIYPEVWLQLAPYARWFTACYGIPVRRIYPVRLDRGQATLPVIDGKPVRRVKYELGQTFTREFEGRREERHIEFMEGDDIDKAFEAYIHAQELGRWIREHGGRY
jgi:hypothetical protein